MQLQNFLSPIFQTERCYCILSSLTFVFQITQLLEEDCFNGNSSILGVIIGLLIFLWEFLNILKPDNMKKSLFLEAFLSITIGFHLFLGLYLIKHQSLYFEVLVILAQAENLVKGVRKLIIIERFTVFILFSVRLNFFAEHALQSLFYLFLVIFLILKASCFKVEQSKTQKTTQNAQNSEIHKPIIYNEFENTESHFEVLNHFKEAVILFDSNLKIKWHNDFLFQIFDVPKSTSLEQLESIILNIEQEENSMNPKPINMANHDKITQAFKAFHSRVESIVECGNGSDNEIKSPGLPTLKNFEKKPEVITRNVTKSTAALTDFDSSNRFIEFCSKKNFKTAKTSYFLNQNGNFASEHLLPATQKKCVKNFLLEIFSSLTASIFCIVEEESDSQKFNIYGSLMTDKESPKQNYFISFYPYKGEIFVCLRPLNKNDLILSLYNNNLSQSKQLASMCHELRTPLNSVTNMLEILQSEIHATNCEELQHCEYVENALWNSKLLLSSINDFLDFFSITSQLFSLELLKLNIQNFAQEVSDLFRPHAEKKGLKFNLNCRVQKQKFFSTDPKRLRQIIFNLLSNSIRFTQEGFINITIKEKLNFLKFSIKDSGSGIEKNDLINLANFQGINTNSTQTTGGFGLCISNYLANYLGPTISETKENVLFRGLKVKSGFGKGTNISFIVRNNERITRTVRKESLASIQEDLSQSLSVASENRKEKLEKILNSSLTEYKFIDLKSDTKNETIAPSGFDTPVNEEDRLKTCEIEEKCKCPKILAVDDNDFNLFVLSERFRKKNICIDIAHSGVEAIKNIEEFIENKNTNANFCEKCKFYKLILMDIDMPVKNGFETTKELKDLFTKANINAPIVALSAFNQNDMREKANEFGMDDYYEKPFTQENLEKIVIDYI